VNNGYSAKKNPLNSKTQGVNLLASVLTAPLNQITRESSSFGHVRILLDNWPKRQPLSGTKAHRVCLKKSAGIEKTDSLITDQQYRTARTMVNNEAANALL
jgi:hypothetical protein